MPAKIKDHLQQRGTTWHVRLDIPVDVRQAFGNRRILSKSLKTGDKQLAKELSARQVGIWKAQFRAIREQKIRKGDAWREEALNTSEALARFLESRTLDLAGVRPSPPPTPEQIDADNRHSAEVAVLAADFIPLGPKFTFDLRNKPIAEQVGELQAMATWCRDEERTSIINDYSLAPADRKELDAILASPSAYKPKSPIGKSAIAAFRQHYESQNDNARTTAVLISKLEAFSAYLTTQAKPLTFDTVAEYLDTISDKRQTRQGHLWALRKWHKYACRYVQTYRDQFASLPSPFAEHTHARVGKAGGESWEAYTRQEAEQLHAAAVTKGDQELADLIKFACYSGCRIEEIGRIAQANTVLDNNHQPIAFNVEDSKTAAGIRTLPIHPALAPLYAQRLEQTKDGFLFAGKLDSAGKRLNAPQQRFTKLKKAEGFTDRHVFHSFRSTTATQLEQAGANPLVISSILGHQRGSITLDVYSAGASLDQKTEAIKLLEFSF